MSKPTTAALPMPYACENRSKFRVNHERLDLLTHEPHARRLQQVGSRRLEPAEVFSATASSVDGALGATLVPESAAVVHCAVVVVSAVGKPVVVAVVRGKHHSTLVSECIVADVTRETRRVQLVVVRFALHCECAVLGP